MDPETNLPDLTDDFASTIDDLSDALSPILSTPLTSLNSTLPTLDKAKLHILTAYTLESLLFSALQASGADAKAHPIFPELARLKKYFGKVKDAEAAGEGKGGPTSKLDKDAAARFIRHGLSGNERYDKERAERLAKEKARAALKARQMAEKVNKKFDDDVESKVQEELGRKRKADEDEESDEDSDSSDSSSVEPQADVKHAPNTDTLLPSDSDHVDSENADFYGEEMDVESTPATPSINTPSKGSKKDKKDKKSSKRRKNDAQTQPPRKKKSKDPKTTRPQELILPERGEAPKTHSETFNQLLSGTFAEQKKEKKKSKDKKGKGKKA